MEIPKELDKSIESFVEAATKLLGENEVLQQKLAASNTDNDALRSQLSELQNQLSLAKQASVVDVQRIAPKMDANEVEVVLRDLQAREALPDNSEAVFQKIASVVGEDPYKLIDVLKRAVAITLPPPAKSPGKPLGIAFQKTANDGNPSLEDYLDDPAPGREHEVPRRR